MATTMTQPTGTPRPASAAGPRRVVSVRASLLPDEVVSARQAVVVRKQVLLALCVLLGLLVAWYAVSWWQTSSARTDLEDMQHQNSALTRQQDQFRPVLEAQSGTSRIQTQLRTLMAHDLSWNDLIKRVQGAAPAGVAVTDFDGTVPDAAPGTPLATVGGAVGSLTLTGTAHDKNSIAAFADKLGKLPGLTSPLVTSVAAQGKVLNFSIDVGITSAALGGRYTTTAPTTTAPTTGGN